MAANRLIVAGFDYHTGSETERTRPVIVVFDDAGHILASIATPDFRYPVALAVNRKGRITACMSVRNSVGLYEIHQYHRDGWREPTTVHHRGALVSAMCYDAAGNLYLTGAPVNDAGIVPGIAEWPRSGYYTTRKFDPDGNELWRVDNGTGMYGPGGRIHIDTAGDVLVAVFDPKEGALRKYDGATGALLWDFSIWAGYLGGFANVITDSANNVYVVGRSLTDQATEYLYKISPSGVLLASSAEIMSLSHVRLAFDSGGLLHSIGRNSPSQTAVDSWNTTVDSNLNFIAAANLPDYPYMGIASGYRAAFDSDGGIYLGNGKPTSGIIPLGATLYQLMRVDPAGTAIIWGYEHWWPQPRDIDGYWSSCTCVEVIDDAEWPAIRIPLGLGTPAGIGGDKISSVPGIPLRIALGAPTVVREYAGSLSQIYRAQLTGGAGPITLPLESLSCRRSGGSLSISLVCPAPSLDLIAEIDARRSGDIVIYRGFRLPGGVQMDEMLRAPFLSVRSDRGPRRASLSIEARRGADPVNPKTRALKGISYRNAQNGARRVRCEIDTYLKPGDTADLGGGETMLVNAISYSIFAGSATMEVSESEP